MKNLKIILTMFLLIFAVACDNAFEGSADDGSKTAKENKYENYLNDKEFQKIINELGGNPNDLKIREAYILQMAYLGRAGFSIVDNLGKLMDNDANTDGIGILMSMQNKVDNVTLSKLDYDSAINICRTAPVNISSDKEIKTACGLAVTMKTMLGTSALVDLATDLSPSCTIDNFSGCGDLADLQKLVDAATASPEIVDILIDSMLDKDLIVDIVTDVISVSDDNVKDTLVKVDEVMVKCPITPGDKTKLKDLLQYISTGEGSCKP